MDNPNELNFCITPIGDHPDLEIVVFPISVAIPGFDAQYKIQVKNIGNKIQSGTASITYDDTTLDYISSNPIVASTQPNSLSWGFDGLAPFQTAEILVVFNLNSPIETPPLTDQNILVYSASLISSELDETPVNNVFELKHSVVNSFDPNDKTCLEGATIAPGLIGQYVHYKIRFENTGTYMAQNIVVKDMIDLSRFDINSLVPVNGSHPFMTRITGTDNVEFIFENINLPFDDLSNDGYLVFKIKTLPTLQIGNSLENTAYIYFDYNFPIKTNRAITIIQALGTAEFSFDNYFTLYPNPAEDVLHINPKRDIAMSSIEVFTVLGQLVLALPNSKHISDIDISSLAKGNYFIKINTDKGKSIARFLKE